MAHEWYVQHGGKEHGPLTSGNLKRLAADGKITPATSVRLGAAGTWVPASRVQGLFPSAAASAAPQAAPPAAPPPAPPMANPLARAPLPKATPVAKTAAVPAGSLAGKVLAGVALILGILALATCWLPILGGVVGFIGIAVGGLGLLLGLAAFVIAVARKGAGLPLSIAGTSASLVGLVMALVLGFHFGLFGTAAPKPPPIVAAAPMAPPPKIVPPRVEPAPTPEPEPEPEPVWVDASEVIEQGPIRARVVSAGIEKIRLESMDISTLKAAKPAPMLIVRVSLQNIAEDKIISFMGWNSSGDLVNQGLGQLLGTTEAGKALQSATAAAMLKDNFGNSYTQKPQVLIMGAGLKVEAVQPIRPGDSGKCEMVFDVPLSSIEFLRLELSPVAYGGAEPLRFQIPKSMITGL